MSFTNVPPTFVAQLDLFAKDYLERLSCPVSKQTLAISSPEVALAQDMEWTHFFPCPYTVAPQTYMPTEFSRNCLNSSLRRVSVL